MANQLPPTLPAPAAVALLDQEDIDEVSGHIANLEGAADQQASFATELRRRANEADALSRVNRGIAKRLRDMFAERTETTK